MRQASETKQTLQDRGKTEAEHRLGKGEDKVIKNLPRGKEAASRTTSLLISHPHNQQFDVTEHQPY